MLVEKPTLGYLGNFETLDSELLTLEKVSHLSLLGARLSANNVERDICPLRQYVSPHNWPHPSLLYTLGI